MNEKLKKIVKIIDEKKGTDIAAIQIDELTIIADCFIIASGTSNVHVRSLADEIEEQLKKDGVEPLAVEGRATGWILLDYGDILVHLFTPEARAYYNLERLWTDGACIDIDDLITED